MIERAEQRRRQTWRLIGWGAAAALLVLPFVAMQLGNEVEWTLIDFVVFGAMLAIAGGAVEFAVRTSRSGGYRAGAAVAVAAAFMLVWVNLAVGFLGDEGNPANLMFLGVIAVAIAGAALSRGSAQGMATAMLAAAAAQLLAGVVGLTGGYASPGPAGVYEVVMGTSLFGALWLLAAWLFRRAART
ncbi:MAG: hypothetical protein ABIT69_08085 [Sphingomicrobium sp.]